jgi:hypothetical protein
MTLDEARFELERRLLQRRAEGLSAAIEQIDCHCDDGVDVLAYVYLRGEEWPLTVLFAKPPGAFDHRACSQALLRKSAATVH